MKLKLIATLTAVALTQSVFAAPAACPEVNAIQKVGIEFSGPSQYGWIGATRANNYNTQDKWAFIMLGITDASSADEAVSRYNDALGSLNFQQGPVQADDQKTWGCLYSAQENGKDLMGLAMTPVPDDYPSLSSLKNISFK